MIAPIDILNRLPAVLGQDDPGAFVGPLMTLLFILLMIGSAIYNAIKQARQEREKRQRADEEARRERRHAPPQAEADEDTGLSTGPDRGQTRVVTKPRRDPHRRPEEPTNPLDLFLESMGLEERQTERERDETPAAEETRNELRPEDEAAPPPLPGRRPSSPAIERAAERGDVEPSEQSQSTELQEPEGPSDDDRQSAIHADRLARQEAARATQQRVDISKQIARQRQQASRQAGGGPQTAAERHQASRHLERKAQIEHAPEHVREQLRQKAGGEESVVLGRLPATGERYPCQLIDVVDGDTLRVDLDGEPVTVRLIGIEAPSYGEPFYRQASESLGRLVYNKELELEYERPGRRELDSDQKLLAYLFADGWLVNRQLLEQGWVWVFDGHGRRRLRNDLMVAQGQARMRHIGVWRRESETPRERLARVQSGNELVHAIVLSELLKPPRALRGVRKER